MTKAAKTTKTRPGYYGGPEAVYEPWKVIEAWGLTYHRGDAVAYIMRAGKKPNSDEIHDLEKAIAHLENEVRILKGRRAGARRSQG